jgi:hypothetical protein
LIVLKKSLEVISDCRKHNKMVPYVRVHVAAAAASLVWLVVPVPFVFRRHSRQVTPADRPVEMAALAPSALASTVAAASIVVVLVLVPPAVATR